MRSQHLSQLENGRLIAFFGESAARQIVSNIDNLDGVFGEASKFIVMVIEGKILPEIPEPPRRKKKREVY